MRASFLRGLVVALILALGGIPVTRAQEFGHSYAIVIGIDQYASTALPVLKSAGSDAKAVADFLKSQNYDVTLLLDRDATRQKILDYFLTIERNAKDDDRLVFYFNGHGFTDQLGQETVGYIVPYDGAGPSTMISMDDIRTQSARLHRVRHQLFVLNSCFGGLLGMLRPAAVDPRRPDYLVQITTRQAREFITAGGADQSVRDDGRSGLSYFTYYFLEATRDGYADRDGKGVITFADLASYLVPRAANSNQTPAWGVLPGDAGGEYIFSTKPTPATAVSHPLPTPPEPSGASQSLTRSADLAVVVPNLESMRKPIDDLYRAWQGLDLDLYIRQWAPDARYDYLQQGRRLSRTRDELIARRRQDFGRLASVEVPKYQIVYEGFAGGVGKFDAEYTMVFRYKDGHEKTEHERESYEVSQASPGDPWLIKENHDYLK